MHHASSIIHQEEPEIRPSDGTPKKKRPSQKWIVRERERERENTGELDTQTHADRSERGINRLKDCT